MICELYVTRITDNNASKSIPTKSMPASHKWMPNENILRSKPTPTTSQPLHSKTLPPNPSPHPPLPASLSSLHTSQYLHLSLLPPSPTSPYNAKSTIAMSTSPLLPIFATTHGDHTVKVISTATFKVEKELKGHPRTPWCVKVRNFLLGGGGKGEVRQVASSHRPKF